MLESKSGLNNRVLYLACIMAGAFAAFLTPDFQMKPIRNHNWVESIIAFQIDHMNLLLIVTLAWLIFWILKKRVKGPEALIVFVGLGFVLFRLLLAIRGLLP